MFTNNHSLSLRFIVVAFRQYLRLSLTSKNLTETCCSCSGQIPPMPRAGLVCDEHDFCDHHNTDGVLTYESDLGIIATVSVFYALSVVKLNEVKRSEATRSKLYGQTYTIQVIRSKLYGVITAPLNKASFALTLIHNPWQLIHCNMEEQRQNKDQSTESVILTVEPRGADHYFTKWVYHTRCQCPHYHISHLQLQR